MSACQNKILSRGLVTGQFQLKGTLSRLLHLHVWKFAEFGQKTKLFVSLLASDPQQPFDGLTSERREKVDQINRDPALIAELDSLFVTFLLKTNVPFIADCSTRTKTGELERHDPLVTMETITVRINEPINDGRNLRVR